MGVPEKGEIGMAGSASHGPSGEMGVPEKGEMGMAGSASHGPSGEIGAASQKPAIETA